LEPTKVAPAICGGATTARSAVTQETRKSPQADRLAKMSQDRTGFLL
jgi:hypothetical protein